MTRYFPALTLNALLAVLAVGAIAACAPKPSPVTHETLLDVPVPVAQPCVDGERPAPVPPLRELITPDAWTALDVRQKAALVGKQGLDLRAYGEDLNAATGACPAIQPRQ